MTLSVTQPDIIVVDDTPANLTLLSTMLKGRGYRVRPFPLGQLALAAARKTPPDLILLDINMPEMDGYAVCEALKADATLRETPVIFISALTETMDKVKAFTIGGVDYITKPFQFEEVVARVETHLSLRRYQVRLEEMVSAQVQEIADSQMATLVAMAKLAESRDDDTGQHIERVQTYCRMLAVQMSQKERDRDRIDEAFLTHIYYASPLHDIGKVGIPDAILLKPGKLTPDEFTIMKTHPLIGARTLEEVQRRYPQNAFVTMGIAIARSHHEKWDGNGYPDGLVGEAIPLEARIMAVADVYDALRSARVYKPPFSHEESIEIITKGSGTHFDPVMIEAFLAIHEACAAMHQQLAN